jgi:hypothetical protein
MCVTVVVRCFSWYEMEALVYFWFCKEVIQMRLHLIDITDSSSRISPIESLYVVLFGIIQWIMIRTIEYWLRRF